MADAYYLWFSVCRSCSRNQFVCCVAQCALDRAANFIKKEFAFNQNWFLHNILCGIFLSASSLLSDNKTIPYVCVKKGYEHGTKIFLVRFNALSSLFPHFLQNTLCFCAKLDRGQFHENASRIILTYRLARLYLPQNLCTTWKKSDLIRDEEEQRSNNNWRWKIKERRRQ